MIQLNLENAGTSGNAAAIGEYFPDRINGVINGVLSVGIGGGGVAAVTAAQSPVFTGITYNNGWGTDEDEKISKINERISVIEDQMLILRTDKLLEEKYPALKEAYDAYQIILKMVKHDGKA